MTKVQSRYKFLGGFGLLVGLNLLFGLATFKILTAYEISYDKVSVFNEKYVLRAYAVLLGLNLLFLTLLATQSKFIIVDKKEFHLLTQLSHFYEIHINGQTWTITS